MEVASCVLGSWLTSRSLSVGVGKSVVTMVKLVGLGSSMKGCLTYATGVEFYPIVIRTVTYGCVVEACYLNRTNNLEGG